MTASLHRAALFAVSVLAGCGPDTLTPAARTALATGVTFAHIAVETGRTVPAMVAGGQLFCAADGVVFAVLAADAQPTNVTGQPAARVEAACKAVSPTAVPVPPPSRPGSAPTLEPFAPIIPPAP